MTPIAPQQMMRFVSRSALLLVLALLLAACDPGPIQRPREGAAPVVGGTPVRLEQVPPPTLIAFRLPTATPEPSPPPASSPSIAASPAPASSPGLAPIISGLQPAPGASLPAGDVVIGARVSGSSNLVDITAFVDGEAIPLEPIGGEVRVKVVSFVRSFSGGSHEVRIQARDERGQLGGYRWQFTITGARQPQVEATASTQPAAPTSAVQTRTPIPIPTRRPTNAPPAVSSPAPVRR